MENKKILDPKKIFTVARHARLNNYIKIYLQFSEQFTVTDRQTNPTNHDKYITL